MKSQILKLSIFLILWPFLLVSCEQPLSLPIESQQLGCYFQYEYINHAWGYNHKGFTITPSGKVYAFDKATPWTFAKDNVISASALDSNIVASVKVDTLISTSDLARFQHLAFLAMYGKTSAPEQRGADMGAQICKIIVPGTGKPDYYTEIILSQTGDIEYHNLLQEASLIKDWLSGISLP